MLLQIEFIPEQASTHARSVDALFYFLLAVCGSVGLLISIVIFAFVIRFRRRHPDQRAAKMHGSVRLETAWSLLPLVFFMIFFAWGAVQFGAMTRPPENTLKIYVLGKQWMWKLWHEEGPSEINELHVPTGAPVELVMISEDVIHSFYIPAFRVKQDVLPGRYTSLWFEAVRPGSYNVFCAEYCGAEHSRMIGKVHVLEPAAYAQWLQGGRQGETMASAGARIFQRFGCATCHMVAGAVPAPRLEGLWGREVELESGETVIADHDYIRRAILDPRAEIVSGYEPQMPEYDQLTDEQLLLLIEYIQSLSEAPGAAGSQE